MFRTHCFDYLGIKLNKLNDLKHLNNDISSSEGITTALGYFYKTSKQSFDPVLKSHIYRYLEKEGPWRESNPALFCKSGNEDPDRKAN